MNLLFFCTRWGHENMPWTDFCKKVKNAGYDGVETTLPLDAKGRTHILNELNKYDLKLIAVQWNTGTADFDQHIKEYGVRLRSATSANPLFITSHTGKDFFSFEQNEELLNLAQRISDDTGVKIVHETHRGKFSFAAHITRAYLEKLPWLKLTLDISHWFAVAESYLADQPAAVDMALLHTDHIHVRIGYVNGPQVNEPRAPEWEEVIQKHLLLWDQVVDLHKLKGSEQLTFTTEFGPPPYMQLLPYTEIPVSNQFIINEYMLNLLKKRYGLPYHIDKL